MATRELARLGKPGGLLVGGGEKGRRVWGEIPEGETLLRSIRLSCPWRRAAVEGEDHESRGIGTEPYVLGSQLPRYVG